MKFKQMLESADVAIQGAMVRGVEWRKECKGEYEDILQALKTHSRGEVLRPLVEEILEQFSDLQRQILIGKRYVDRMLQCSPNELSAMEQLKACMTLMNQAKSAEESSRVLDAKELVFRGFMELGL